MSFYIKNESEFTYEIEKSKFISIIRNCKNSEELQGFLTEIKVRYPKARHYCYALVCEECSRSSDDGEPSGTAGKPLLELINKLKINNVAVIVVRYFGGIKLGASRLLRSYVTSAKSNFEQTKLYKQVEVFSYDLEVDMKEANNFKNYCALNYYSINKIYYNSQYVEFSISSEEDISEYLNSNSRIKIVKSLKTFDLVEV